MRLFAALVQAIPYCVVVYRGGVTAEPDVGMLVPGTTLPPAAAHVTPVEGATLQEIVAVPPKATVRFGVRVMTGAELEVLSPVCDGTVTVTYA